MAHGLARTKAGPMTEDDQILVACACIMMALALTLVAMIRAK